MVNKIGLTYTNDFLVEEPRGWHPKEDSPAQKDPLEKMGAFGDEVGAAKIQVIC